jgi:hypothetical protein
MAALSERLRTDSFSMVSRFFSCLRRFASQAFNLVLPPPRSGLLRPVDGFLGVSIDMRPIPVLTFSWYVGSRHLALTPSEIAFLHASVRSKDELIIRSRKAGSSHRALSVSLIFCLVHMLGLVPILARYAASFHFSLMAALMRRFVSSL